MRGLTGERPEKDGRRSGDGGGTGRRRLIGRRGVEEGSRRDAVMFGRDDLREDMFQALVRESVGVALAIGVAIAHSVILSLWKRIRERGKRDCVYR